MCEHGNQIEVTVTRTFWVDECLVPEILWLNNMKIRTESCCCGHGGQGGILINATDQVRARELGYAPVNYYLKDGTYTGLCEIQPQMKVSLNNSGYVG